jgi:hypothetical protein
MSIVKVAASRRGQYPGLGNFAAFINNDIDANKVTALRHVTITCSIMIWRPPYKPERGIIRPPIGAGVRH